MTRCVKRPLFVALALGLAALLAGCGGSRPAPPSDPAPEAFAWIRKAGGLTAQQLRGRDIFRAHCDICHGTTGKGDGFNAFNLNPHPRDLTRIVGVRTPEDLRLSVERGGRRQGLSPLMPPYESTLDPDGLDDVVSYVRTLASGPVAAGGAAH
ncbi:MAG: c-type cytochrome [Candidatus Wallbacteria bacterium]|nr:c-type cytochrome [Candidatus Wallbacteria bacterium]